jgi:hypothetical protein
MNQVLLSLSSVKAFRDYSVKLGVVQVSDAEFVEHLNDTYSEVSVCGLNVKAGSALQQLSPMMFDAIKAEYQEELQHSLQGQLAAGNDVDIDWQE